MMAIHEGPNRQQGMHTVNNNVHYCCSILVPWYYSTSIHYKYVSFDSGCPKPSPNKETEQRRKQI